MAYIEMHDIGAHLTPSSEREGYLPSPDQEQIVRRWRSTAGFVRPEIACLQVEIGGLESEYCQIVGDNEGASRDAPDPALAAPGEEARRLAEEAWRARQARWLEHRPYLNSLFLRLLHLRQRLAVAAGVSDYRAYQWLESGYLDFSPQDAQGYYDAIAEELVPVIDRWLSVRTQRQGARNVRPWDLGMPPVEGPPLHPYNTLDELQAGAAGIFTQVDPEFGAFFEQLRDGALFLGNDANRAPFNEEFNRFSPPQPYVFVWTDGTFHDVTLLFHECGHAFHDMLTLAHQDLVWNSIGMSDICSEFTAMASMYLSYPYLERDEGGFYSRADAKRARRAQVERAIYHMQQPMVEAAFHHWVSAQPLRL